MSKPVLTLYLCLMRNEDLRLDAIARLAAPVIISEFLEEALIVTDSILLSYMPSVYLASVGIIDAILLIILAYGIALNDSYQNYFARYQKSMAKIRNIRNSCFSICNPAFIIWRKISRGQ